MATAEQQAAFAAEVQRFERIATGTEQPREGDVRAGVIPAGTFTPVSRPDVREPSPEQQRQKVADLDLSLQRQGLQRPNVAVAEPDQRVLGRINAKRAELGANATPDQLRQYEEALQLAYAGWRDGESMAQFRERIAAANRPDSNDTGALSEADRAVVAKYDGMIAPAEHIKGELASGYVLPPGEYMLGETVRMLAQAKAAGVTQAQVDAFLRAGD